jgi:post-segregation antitoxin (ccd killing protein)
MARPNEFVDLRTTSVTLEGDLLERAKANNINISRVLRRALARELGEVPKKAERRLRKFRGIPLHIVNNVRNSLISRKVPVDTLVNSLNESFGRGFDAGDLDALVPRF